MRAPRYFGCWEDFQRTFDGEASILHPSFASAGKPRGSMLPLRYLILAKFIVLPTKLLILWCRRVGLNY
jgi:hypothetical protein